MKKIILLFAAIIITANCFSQHKVEFELRDVINNGYIQTVSTDTSVAHVIFSITLIVGIKGNTYPMFLNQQKTINVICNLSDSGVVYEQKIEQKATEAVNIYFPSIN